MHERSGHAVLRLQRLSTNVTSGRRVRQCAAALLYAALALIVVRVGAQPSTAPKTDSEPPAARPSESILPGLDSVYALHPWLPRVVGAQFTFIWQDLSPFRSPYSGRNSLTSLGDRASTQTYGVYLGLRASSRLQFYADFEMARGSAVGRAVGLGGLTNGDVIREGAVNLGQGPYLARSFVRYLIPIGRDRDTASVGLDQVPGDEPAERLELKLGKFALNDDIDVNRYAGSTRYQFTDWSLWGNTTWDFASNTRGYTNGILLGYERTRWALRFTAAQMPLFANGNTLDDNIRLAYGLNAELTMRPGPAGTVLRVLAYDNRARMGIYNEALAIARATGSNPNIVADDRPGRAKYGFGLNVEQPLADSGNTGAFLRLGWSDGASEDFVFAEVNRLAAGGVQVAGTPWHRRDDRLGLAFAVNGLSHPHERYLAAGGLGFVLGDGRLRYAPEEVFEADYRLQLPFLSFVQLTPGIQRIVNPGYNADRGPAVVYTLRVNLHG